MRGVHMKTLLKCLLLVQFTLASAGAFAQSETMRLRMETMQKIQTLCDTPEATFGNSRYVRTEWTGECKAGKLHGDGQLSFEEREADTGKTKYRFVQRGLMVEGRQIGPWHILQSSHPVFVGAYLWGDAPVPGHYVKTDDGGFRLGQPDWTAGRIVAVPTSEPIPAAVVARLLEQARDPAAAGGAPAGKVPYQSALLRDLLRRGTVYSAASRAIPAQGSGSVALVLSTRTMASMTAIESLGKGVRHWAQQQPGAPVRQAAERLAAAADPQVFAQGLAQLLREHFKTVVFAEDIAAVDRSAIDHILVFDLQFEHDVAATMPEIVRLLSGVSSRPASTNLNDNFLQGAPLAGGSFFLLNRELDVVRAHEAAPYKVPFMKPLAVYQPNDAAAVSQQLVFQLDLMAKTLTDTLGREKYLYIQGARFDNTSAVTSMLRFNLREP